MRIVTDCQSPRLRAAFVILLSELGRKQCSWGDFSELWAIVFDEDPVCSHSTFNNAKEWIRTHRRKLLRLTAFHLALVDNKGTNSSLQVTSEHFDEWSKPYWYNQRDPLVGYLTVAQHLADYVETFVGVGRLEKHLTSADRSRLGVLKRQRRKAAA